MKFKATITQTIASYVTIDAADEKDAKRKLMAMKEKNQLPQPVLIDERTSAEPLQDDVVFRIYPNGEVIALLPEYLADDEGNVQSYMHRGQHAAADFDVVFNDTREATPDEYADLKREMEEQGYTINVISAENGKAILDDTDDNIMDLGEYGKCSLVACNSGYGSYFEVYVQSDERIPVFDTLIGSINDTGDSDAMWEELLDLMKNQK